MSESSFNHAVYRCSYDIEKLIIKIRLEQVIQYGVKSANNKPVDLTSNNFRIEESFVWMKKISKPLAPLSNIESNFQNVESDLNQVQAKDLFYSVTSEDNITNDINLPFESRNLGHHCENYLTKLLTLRRKLIDSDAKSQLGYKTSKESESVNHDIQFMHIVLNLSSLLKGDPLNDFVLVSLKYNARLGELTLYPSPNEVQHGYKLAPRGLTPPFFLYWISLVQQQHAIHPEPHGSVAVAIPSSHFEEVTNGSLAMTIFLTISKFKLYNINNGRRFFINYSLNLPKGWSTSPDADNQTSNTHTSIDIDNGIFQHLICYSLVYHLNIKEGMRWPNLVMGLVSGCSNLQEDIEGFCSVNVPPKPGRYCYCLPLSKYQEKLKSGFSYFLNGSSINISQGLLTPSSSVNDGLQGRYGMVSEVIGILEIELQIIHQAAK